MDAIFGSRFCPGGQIKDLSVLRKLISWGGTWMSNAILGTRLHDMTSGFQMFRRDALIAVLDRGIKARAHFFQTEMKVRCRNMRICEVPITYRSASPNVNLASIIDALSRLCSLSLERVRGML